MYSLKETGMKFLKDLGHKLSIFKELWEFMRVRKVWWLGPIVVLLVLLGLLIIFAESSALSPFIYALF